MGVYTVEDEVGLKTHKKNKSRFSDHSVKERKVLWQWQWVAGWAVSLQGWPEKVSGSRERWRWALNTRRDQPWVDYRKEGGRGQSESGSGRLNEAFGFYWSKVESRRRSLNISIEMFRSASLKDQFSRSVVSDSLRPHGQHARPPCPSPAPGACSDSRPLSRWCHPTISTSVIPFSSCHHLGANLGEEGWWLGPGHR